MNEEWNDNNNKKSKQRRCEISVTGLSIFFVFYGVLRVLRYARFWHGLKQHRHRVSRDIKLRFHLLARYKSWQIRKLHRICPHHRADIYISHHIRFNIQEWIFYNRNKIAICSLLSRAFWIFTRDWNSRNDGVEMENRREASRVHKKSSDIHCMKCKRKRLSLIKLSRDREIRERVQLKSTVTTAGIHQFGILQLKIANARRRWGHFQRAEESRKRETNAISHRETSGIVNKEN